MSLRRKLPRVRQVSRAERWLLASLSGFRDYLNHASEYQYTVAEIERIIGQFGFRFLGFRASSLKAKYGDLFPDDPGMTSLANWRRFEPHYVGSHEMLSFWLQKPHSGPG